MLLLSDADAPTPEGGSTPSGHPAALPTSRAGRLDPAWEITARTETAPELRQRLAELGWRQGAVLPSDASITRALTMIPFGQQEIPAESPHWLIVASQDCDVINGNLEIEPAVELLVATAIDRVYQSNTHLRHPQELHFHMLHEDGNEQPVAVNVRGRAFLDRGKLLELHPDESILVPRHAIAEIAGLLGGRYDRTAFPDAFDKRFRSAKRRLDSTLEHYMAELSDILVGLTPFEELHSESEIYDLRGGARRHR